MATSMRGSIGSGKEKRGTSPSSSTIKKTPKPLPSPSSPSGEKTSLSTDSSKPVPNYLRPTISSSPDPNKQSKKTSADTSVSNPTHTRRRSIDLPPPAAQVQRAAWGSPVGARDFKTQRSSSFSNKSTVSPASSARPASEKLYARTSSLKEGRVEPNLSKSRSIKKSTLSASTKKEPTSNYRKKAPKSVTSESSVDCENRLSVDRLILEDDLEIVDAHEVHSLPDMSEMPNGDEELSDPTNVMEEEDLKKSTLEEIHHDEEEKSTVVDKVVEETEQVETEQANPQPVVEESTNIDDASEQVDEGVGDKQDEGVGDQQDEGGSIHQEQAEEKVPEVEPIDATMEEEKEEIKEQIETEDKKDEVLPAEAKDESQTVSRPAASSATPTKTLQPSSAGKKDKQVYNDVIEETTTKLMGAGARKNKVLALAGAFETVISLQDTNKS